MIKFDYSPSYFSSDEWVTFGDKGAAYFGGELFDIAHSYDVFDYMKICSRYGRPMQPDALACLIVDYKQALDWGLPHKNNAYTYICACSRFLLSEYRACPSSDIVNILQFLVFGACALGCHELQLELMEGIEKYFGGASSHLESLII